MKKLTLRQELLPGRHGHCGAVGVHGGRHRGAAHGRDGREGRRGGEAGDDWSEGTTLLIISGHAHPRRELGEEGGGGGGAGGGGAPGPVVAAIAARCYTTKEEEEEGA